jgi:hypothetical protein
VHLQCPAGTIDQLGNQYGPLVIHRHNADRNGLTLCSLVCPEPMVPIDDQQLPIDIRDQQRFQMDIMRRLQDQ